MRFLAEKQNIDLSGKADTGPRQLAVMTAAGSLLAHWVGLCAI
jgi:hypothetical protein